MRMIKTLAAMTAAALLSSSPANAEDAAAAPEPDFTTAASITLVSDYLFRGISQTWGKPALQLWGEVSHRSGLYVGVAASNVSDEMYPGTNIETDLMAGLRGKLPGALSGVNYDIGLTYIYYPGGNYDEAKFTPRYEPSKFDTLEAALSLNYQWATLKMGSTLTEFFGWNTNNSSIGTGFYGDPEAGVTGTTKGSWFVEASGAYEVAPGWTVSALAGHQTIRNSRDLDWSYYKAGVTRTFAGAWAANLSYAATDDTKAYQDFWGMQNDGHTLDVNRARVLFSLTRSF